MLLSEASYVRDRPLGTAITRVRVIRKKETNKKIGRISHFFLGIVAAFLHRGHPFFSLTATCTFSAVYRWVLGFGFWILFGLGIGWGQTDKLPMLGLDRRVGSIFFLFMYVVLAAVSVARCRCHRMFVIPQNDRGTTAVG